MTNIAITRIYEEPDPKDGTRILVDRVWPRGVSRARAQIDLWLKDIAPSNDLRKWFAHDPAKWTDFQIRYNAELKENKEQVALLKQQAAKGRITLLYAARNNTQNEAIV